jgi:hypothetical protein
MSKTKTEGYILRNASFRARKIMSQHMYILLFIPLVFIIYPLTGLGFPISQDFPTIDSPHYPSDRLWAWWDKGSIPGLEGLSRFPFFGLWHALVIIGLDVALLTKLNIVTGFLVASFSFYFSFWLLFRKKILGDGYRKDLLLKSAAILGALFYAYNPWSFERVVHWYLWIGYALLPLFFVALVLVSRDPKNLKYLLLSVFLWSLASATPQMAIYYGVILVSTFFVTIINKFITQVRYGGRDKRPLFQLSMCFLSIILLFTLVNLYWIYPFILSSQIRPVSPNYLLVQENVDSLSRQNDALSTITLVGNYLERQVGNPIEYSMTYELWVLSGITIPLFAFSALFIAKRFIKYTLIFSSMAVVGVILAMGTQSPFNYFELLFGTPILSGYLWLFRDPDKLSFLIAFGISFLVGINSYSVLRSINRMRNHGRKQFIAAGFLLLIIGTISIYSYPVYKLNMEVTFRPVTLPPEFNKLNEYFSKIDTDKIYFIPYPMYETQWSRFNRVGDIYQTQSIKPSIESSGFTGLAGMGAANYYNYLARSISNNRTNNIDKSIYPLGTSYLVFHNDTWDKRVGTSDPENLKLLEQLERIFRFKNTHNIGFYKIFEADGNDGPQQFNVFKQSMTSFGGLDSMSALNGIQPFSSLNSSVLFVDDMQTNGTDEYVQNSDYLILDNDLSFGELLFTFVDEKYIVEPSASVSRYDPKYIWSKSGATDPDFGAFHPHLDALGIHNGQFDYGKGLIMTQAIGANVSIPVETEEAGQYDLYARYLNNQKGGTVRVFVDDEYVGEINSQGSKNPARFVSEKIGPSLNFTSGSHNLKLENVVGFNVLNLFAIIPTNETSKISNHAYSLASNAENIYLLEGESDFNNGKGKRISNSKVPLIEHDGSDDLNKRVSGEFKVPSEADLMSLQFFTDSNITGTVGHNNTSYFLVKDLQIYPAIKKHRVFSQDFDRHNITGPLAKLRQSDLIIRDEDLSSSLKSTSDSSDSNIRIDVSRGRSTDWHVVSTEFIPIDGKGYYNVSMDLSSQDVNQLHAKVNYYDTEKRRISSDFISEGRDGTFSQNLNASVIPPPGGDYAKLELLVRPNSGKTSYFLVDNINFDELIPKPSLHTNEFGIFKPVPSVSTSASSEQYAKNKEYNNVLTNNYNDSSITKVNGIPTLEEIEKEPNHNSSRHEYKLSLSSPTITSYSPLETKPMPIKANTTYAYEMDVQGENMERLSAIASFSNSRDVIENSTKYGSDASLGSVLSLAPDSEIYAYLDILKSSNYMIALRYACPDKCNPKSPLTIEFKPMNPNEGTRNVIPRADVSSEDNYDSFTVQGYNSRNNKDNNSQDLTTAYLNSTFLNQGKYEIRIHSNSQVDLDSLILYSTDAEAVTGDTSDEQNQYETLEDLFNPSDTELPASIASFTKINPTKYEVKIVNASRPYVFSFAETYDPLWVAYYDRKADDGSTNNGDSSYDFKKRSVPLYSIVNGFFINKTGDYNLIIEYEPQKWMTEAGLVSSFTILFILVYLLLRYRKNLSLWLKGIR